jgi:hypothetical protein
MPVFVTAELKVITKKTSKKSTINRRRNVAFNYQLRDCPEVSKYAIS